MAVRFHLPGFRNNFPVNMLLIELLKEYPQYFREGIEIASIYGEFPTSLWNGGRFNGGDQCDESYIKTVISYINDLGIPIRYTYTNPLLTAGDLNDKYCNYCMQEADNGMNEVLVVSPILEDYIRKQYPGFVINSSTCKEIRNIDAVNEELKKDYGLVVLDYNYNNDFDELEKISDKKRCEILVNACCIPNCPRRGDHYKTISRMQRISLANRKLPVQKQMPMLKWKCEYGENSSPAVTRTYSTHVTPDAIWNQYVPMGFCNFKIEGRTSNLFLLIENYCYYFAKPEYKEDVRLLMLTNLVSNKVLYINKPKPGVWP